MSLSRSLYLCRFFFPSWDTPSRLCTHTLSPHFKLIPITHTLLVSLSHMHSVLLHSPSLSHTHGLFATISKMPMHCMEHQDALVWVVYLVGEKDERGRPYLQMWRGVWVSFCKITIVSFLSVRYRSDVLYCRMVGPPSSPTLFCYPYSYKKHTRWWSCASHPAI